MQTDESGDVVMALRWAPGYASHNLSPVEVALLSELGSHVLRGRAYAVVCPLIDGHRTADEVAAAAGGDAPATHVHFALLRLQELGLVVAVDAAQVIAEPASGRRRWIAVGRGGTVPRANADGGR